MSLSYIQFDYVPNNKLKKKNIKRSKIRFMISKMCCARAFVSND